jgi:hypothetical protein
MAEQVTMPPSEEFDEFYITPVLEQDNNAFFVTGAEKPGEMYVETPDANVYRINVGGKDVTVESGAITREGFVSNQEPLAIARNGLVTILGQPRSARSSNAAPEFDMRVGDDTVSIFSEEQPIRILAPAGYLRIPPPEEKQ